MVPTLPNSGLSSTFLGMQMRSRHCSVPAEMHTQEQKFAYSPKNAYPLPAKLLALTIVGKHIFVGKRGTLLDYFQNRQTDIIKILC